MPANKPTRPFAFPSAAPTRREVTRRRGHGEIEPEAAPGIPLLIIVANTDAALCKCVKEAFAESETVRVILDRRRGDRRQEARKISAERRYGERRDRLLIGEHLRSHGWAFVHRPWR